MKAARWWALAGSVGLVVSGMGAMAGPAAASGNPTPAPHRMALRGSLVPARERSHPAGSVAAKSSVGFGLVLSLHNATGARAFLREVSSPGSPLYHRYLTDAQWESRFGPTKAAVGAGESRGFGAKGSPLGSVPKDRLFVSARGSGAQC